MLFAVAGTVLLALVYLVLILHHARNVEDAFFDFLLVGIIIGVQYYYITRIRDNWQAMTKERRWWTGVAAFIIPPIAAVLGGILAVFGIVFGIIILVARLFWGSSRSLSLGFRLTGVRSTDSTAWTPDFGNWWGNERVIRGPNGQPLWVGDNEVKYGSDGMPIWVGNCEVKYGVDRRPAWIGDDKVIFGSDGQVPKWIGDQKIS